jgi:hypothetical protein
MNVFQRLNEVRKAVAYVKKDKAVQNYKAVSHDMVVAVCRDAFVKHGIVTYPEQIRGVMNPAGTKASKDGSGTIPDPMRLYEGGYAIHFVNVDEPADRVTVMIEAHALDNGDKAPGKAVTYATKAALLKVLMLETGEDDESRVEHTRTISDEQIAQIEALIVEAKADRPKFLRYLKLDALDSLPAKSFDSVVKILEEKRKASAS